MVNPKNVNPNPQSDDYTLDKWVETMTRSGIPSDFDVITMNPPQSGDITRRSLANSPFFLL